MEVFPAFITRCGNGKNYRMASVLVCIRQTEKEVPGNIHVITDYRFNEDNELSVRHYAETDCATYINMTNHAYFNLRGNGKR